MCAMPRSRGNSGRSASRKEPCTASSASPSVPPSSSTCSSSQLAVALRAGALADAEDLAHERVAVGLQARRGQRDQRVAGLDGGAVDDRFALDDADDEAGDVVVARPVEVGQVRGLAAEQRNAVGLAGRADACHELDAALLRQPRRGQVVEEEERLGAGGEDIVDAVVDEVAADAFVAAERRGEQQLGADAVRARDKHRVPIASDVELEQPGEGAEAAEHLGAARTFGDRAQRGQARLGGGHVDAGVDVPQWARWAR